MIIWLNPDASALWRKLAIDRVDFHLCWLCALSDKEHSSCTGLWCVVNQIRYAVQSSDAGEMEMNTDQDPVNTFDVTTKRFLLKTAIVLGAIVVVLLLGTVESQIQI